MHGRPRKAPKPEEEAASVAKAQKLRALQTQFFSFHHNKIYTKEAVELSAKLLEINPESYTAWNYRKLAVEHYLSQPDCNPDWIKSVLDDELRVVENALRQNFKSYGAWHHRKWVISKGHSSIDNELRLLDKFQKADSRNFHAWNYRRFVAESMKRSEQDELKYTEDMIYKNFSNYSAWHNRSVLLSALFEKKAEGFLSKEKVLPEEYEFIHQAIFTDPDDQSGWFYHLWLLDQTVTTDSPLLASSWPGHGYDVFLVEDRCYNGSAFSPFTALHSDSGSFPIVLYFNQPVGGVSSSTVTVECGFNKNEDLLWKPLSASNSQTARVWVAHLKIPSSDLHSTVEVSVGHSKGIISTRGFEYSHPSMFSFKVRVQPMERDFSQVSVAESISLREESFKIYGTQSEESIINSFNQLSIKYGHESTASNWRSEALAKEIECFRELLSLMDCKIGKLTLARLLMAYDVMSYPFANKLVHSEEVLELYSDLMKLDPTHYQYYKDEHSMVLLHKVTSSKESLLQHCFQYKDSVSSAICGPICLRLNNLSLSRMGAFEKLLWVQMLDLSDNELQSIEGLEAMQLLSCLSLRNNKLRSLTALEPLRKLKLLRVLDISYNQIGDHSIDTTRYLCSSPLSHSVGSESNKDETVTSGVALIDNWEAFYIFKDFNLNQLDIVGNTIADEKFKSVLVKIMPKLKQLDGKLLD